MNQENNNDVYHDDNSFNNQGMDMSDNEPTTGETLGNMANSGMNFAKGINNIKNNPALGLKKPKEKGKESDKKDSNNKNSQNNQNDNDPAKGQKNKKDDSGQMPRTKKNDDSKKPNAKNDSNNKNKSGNNNIGNKNKQGGMFSRFNPMNKTSKSKTGGTKKAAEAGAPNLNQMAKKGLRTAWTAAPIQVKLIIIGIAIIPIIILAFIAFFSIFGATVAATTAAMCGEESGSSYNGADYQGSADEKEFLCKMQHPLGSKRNYVVTSWPGPRWGSTHRGIDLAISKGTPIYAVQSGVVVDAHDGCYDDNRATGDRCGGGAGNHVYISHGGVITTQYMHMVNGSVKVKKGDKVGKGQLIGLVASSGNSKGNHLHFGMLIKGSYVYGYTDYFENLASFKNNCGSMWDGELAGDSANAANNTDDYVLTGSSNSNTECCDTSGSSISSGDYCPNGIVVEGVGTLNLDDYVAGVISAENFYVSSSDPNNIEAMKAQAIAARTYAINRTSNCTKKIGNSQASQVYTTPKEKAKVAAQETAGSVMTYNGNVFSAQYDAFCINDEDCPTASCSGTTCTATYKKVPSSDTHKITVKSPHSKYAYNGNLNNKGHANGMSQYVARQMQDEGKKFDEILKYFYADGINISGVSNQCTLGQGSFDGKIWYFDQTDYKQPYGKYGTISSHGCGPTSMAIAVSSILNEKHDPVELTNYACSNGYCSSDGTYHSFFKAAAKKYGLNCKNVTKSNSDEVLAALTGGKSIVIVIMGPGKFTTEGHFITLTGSNGDQVFVHDPNNGDGKGYNKLWDFDLIKKEASGEAAFWIISK